MDRSSQSIIIVFDDGSTREFDKSFFAVASQDDVGAHLTSHCDMGFIIVGTAVQCASALHSAFKVKDMSRVDSFFFTARVVCDWLRALFIALKEETL